MKVTERNLFIYRLSNTAILCLCRCDSGRDRVLCHTVHGGGKSDNSGRLPLSSGSQNS